MTILQFKNLTVGYKNKVVLKNINLSFETGEFVAIVGPNGSGKTTLINAVFGLSDIFEGEILVEKKKCSAVPQISKPVFNFTVRDFIDLGDNNCHPELVSGSLINEKMLKQVQHDKKMEIIEKLDLVDLLNEGIQEISAGQYQRALIAQSLVKNPEILFLDEPLSHLDLKYQIKIIEFLKNLKGVTVIAVIHHLDFAVKYFERLVFFKNGEIVESENKEINQVIEEVFEIKKQESK